MKDNTEIKLFRSYIRTLIELEIISELYYTPLILTDENINLILDKIRKKYIFDNLREY